MTHHLHAVILAADIPCLPTPETPRELRLGFEVSEVWLALSCLVETGGEIGSDPTVSPWGLRAVVKDIKGHKVELTVAQPVGSEHQQSQESARR